MATDSHYGIGEAASFVFDHALLSLPRPKSADLHADLHRSI